MTYFTLFTADGQVTQLPRKPTPKMIHNMLQSETLEELTLGVYYNGKDHHEATVLFDDIGREKDLPINSCLTKALNDSMFWRNSEYKMHWKSLVVLGDAIVVTNEPIVSI